MTADSRSPRLPITLLFKVSCVDFSFFFLPPPPSRSVNSEFCSARCAFLLQNPRRSGSRAGKRTEERDGGGKGISETGRLVAIIVPDRSQRSPTTRPLFANCRAQLCRSRVRDGRTVIGDERDEKDEPDSRVREWQDKGFEGGEE